MSVTRGLLCRRTSRFLTVCLFVLVLLLGSLASPSIAAVFKVTTAEDAIPAPVGSLRWAVEKSQANAERDSIVIPNSIARIQLVAPLPSLSDIWGVAIQTELVNDPVHPLVVLDGQGVVSMAFSVLGPDNKLTALGFEGFSGSEIVLIQGGAARNNSITSCEFNGAPSPHPVPVAAIHISDSVSDSTFPAGTSILRSSFDGFSQAVRAEAAAPANPSPAWEDRTRITESRFGLDESGTPAAGNDQAITVLNAGPVEIADNSVGRTSDWAISLDGVKGSVIRANQLGVLLTNFGACAGSGGPALRLLHSSNAEVSGNEMLCSDLGIYLGPGADAALVRANEIGSRTPGAGNRRDGIAIDGAASSVIRNNDIPHSGGAGIHVLSGPAIQNQNLFSCNSIWGQPGAAIIQSPSAIAPPSLSGANPLSVKVTLSSPLAGWAELFGGDNTDALVFLGATTTDGTQITFPHNLPVTNLMVGLSTSINATAIRFDSSYPSNLVGTMTRRAAHETSGTSAPTPANLAGLLFDVVRGKVGLLSRDPSGGVDLGPLTCLASLIGPESLPVLDTDPPPAPGTAYFYLARRRIDASTRLGTYDPAICGPDLGDSFTGPRIPGQGDCGP